jgi:hypothetical protein
VCRGWSSTTGTRVRCGHPGAREPAATSPVEPISSRGRHVLAHGARGTELFSLGRTGATRCRMPMARTRWRISSINTGLIPRPRRSGRTCASMSDTASGASGVRSNGVLQDRVPAPRRQSRGAGPLQRNRVHLCSRGAGLVERHELQVRRTRSSAPGRGRLLTGSCRMNSGQAVGMSQRRPRGRDARPGRRSA